MRWSGSFVRKLEPEGVAMRNNRKFLQFFVGLVGVTALGAQPTAAATARYCLQYDLGGELNIANLHTGETATLPEGQLRHPSPDAENGLDQPQIRRDPAYFFEIVPVDDKVALLLQNTIAGTFTPLQTAKTIVAKWSPKRDRLAWLWQDDEGNHLSIATGNGAGIHSAMIENIQGWNSPYNIDSALAWSADTQYLAIAIANRVVILSTSDFKPLSETPYQGAWEGWSPIGHRFVLKTEAGYLVISPDATLTFRVDSEDALANNSGSVAWSPNGRYLIVTAGANTTVALFLFDLQTGTILPPLTGLSLDLNFGEGIHPPQTWDWSPDNRYLIYPAWATGQSELSNTLYTFDTVTGRIASLRANLAWRPDPVLNVLTLGDQIYTGTQTRRGVKVGETDVLGTHPVYFVDDALHVDQITASSDGHYVAFVASATASADPWNNYSTPPATPLPRQPSDRLVWVNTATLQMHTFSYPNARILTWYGKRLFFLAGTPYKSYQILSLDPDSGQTTVLATGISYSRYVKTYVWNFGHWELYPSPDGQAIIFMSVIDFAGTEGGFAVPGTQTVSLRQEDTFGTAIFFAHLDGSLVQTLIVNANNHNAIHWAPDGAMFAWSAWSDPAHMEIISATGQSLLHTDFPGAATVWIACP
jgi:Tol biopolymer transport system component